MKVNVYLPHTFKVNFDADLIVGVDYGAYQLAKQSIMMDVAIGDFDSTNKDQDDLIKKWSKKLIKLNVEKDETDSEAAIMYLQDLGYSDITLFGDAGNRLDHFLINYRLVEKYSVKYILDKGVIFSLKKGIHQIKNEYQVLSLFTSRGCRLSLSGTKYLLADQRLKYFDLYTSSNYIISDFAKLEVFSGQVTVVLSNDK